MSNTFNSTQTNSRDAIRGLIFSLVINVAIPLLIVYLLTHYAATSEFQALCIGSLVPIIYSIVEFIRNRRFDLIALIFLLGTLTSIIAFFLGNDARLLIIRESFFTGALGLVCLLSLFIFPRPLMFYIGRQMMAGKNQEAIARFNAGWQNPRARFVHRVITSVWGCALIGEFIVRLIVAYTLPATLAYGLGSAILTIVLAGTFVWTFAYIRSARRTMQSA